jgi:multiple sugar transport system permease protein
MAQRTDVMPDGVTGTASPDAARRARKRRALIKNVILWTIIVVATAWCLFPFYWAVITSFKPRAVILTTPSLIPWLQYHPTIFNWIDEFSRLNEDIKALKNSIIISVGASILAVSLGTLAGYGLARYRFYRWTNSNMTVWFLSQRFLPPVVTVIPFAIIIKNLGLLDTQLGLILANTTFVIPFAVLVLRDVFRELPIELEESAWVDGASHLQAFWHIALPLAAPAVAAAAVICFAFTWNEFLFALVLTYQKAIPVTVVIAGLEHTQGIQFAAVATRLLLCILPPALLALTAQRYIVRGLTFGAVKG